MNFLKKLAEIFIVILIIAVGLSFFFALIRFTNWPWEGPWEIAEARDLIGLFFPLLGYIFTIFALGGYIGWQQVQERKKEIDESIKEQKERKKEIDESFDKRQKEIDKGIKELEEIRGETGLAFSRLYQNYARDAAKSSQEQLKQTYLRKASGELEKFEQLLPNDYRGPLERGIIEREKGRLLDSFEAFTKAQKLMDPVRPDPEVWYNLAVVCQLLEKPHYASAIVDWLLMAFRAQEDLLDSVFDDDDFKNFKPAYEFFQKVRNDERSAKDVTDDEKKALTEDVRVFCKR